MSKREFERSLRHNQTDAEQKLWFFLRDRRLEGEKFRRQHPVGEYIADFCCVERGLIVELDGGQHAMQSKADAMRTVSLEGHRFRVLRFWDNDVLKNTEGVLEIIRKELGAPSPRPSPPLGGEGVIPESIPSPVLRDVHLSTPAREDVHIPSPVLRDVHLSTPAREDVHIPSPRMRERVRVRGNTETPTKSHD